MTVEGNQTLNDGLGLTSGPDVSSPSDKAMVDPNSEGIIGTVESYNDDGPETVHPDAKGETDSEGEEGEPKTEGSEEEGVPEPFHKHPAWQRLMKEREDARLEAAVAKAKLETVQTFQQPGGERKPDGGAPPMPPPAVPYKDITTLTDDELREWQEENPKGYAANLYAQVLHETRVALDREQKENHFRTGTMKTIDGYKKENPDFDVMWQKGEIQKFMQENPGHNAISAHLFMTSEAKVAARIAAEVEKAKKETEAKILANVKAKQSARVLGGGPAPSGAPKVDEDLKDTKSRGGVVATLADRLMARRKGGT